MNIPVNDGWLRNFNDSYHPFSDLSNQNDKIEKLTNQHLAKLVTNLAGFAVLVDQAIYNRFDFKWTALRQQPETERYVVCNADEAEPGTFKDRELILRQSHKMLEGLAIAAFAVEATEIYIYIRGE